MTSHRILQLNAVSTAACAVAMLVTRGTLCSFFGLPAPILLDVLAIGFLVYAGALAFAAQREPVSRRALMAFTVADGLWVAASIVMLLFWVSLRQSRVSSSSWSDSWSRCSRAFNSARLVHFGLRDVRG